MRSTFLIIAAAASLLAFPSVTRADDDDDLKLEDLPKAVQETIRKVVGTGKIEEIDREKHKGKTCYEVEYEKGGDDREFHVGEDGAILKHDDDDDD